MNCRGNSAADEWGEGEEVVWVGTNFSGLKQAPDIDSDSLLVGTTLESATENGLWLPFRIDSLFTADERKSDLEFDVERHDGRRIRSVIYKPCKKRAIDTGRALLTPPVQARFDCIKTLGVYLIN